jgi:hypothetical protein
MFGAYCAEKIYRHANLRVLVLDAGSFLVSEHVQNLSKIGLNAGLLWLRKWQALPTTSNISTTRTGASMPQARLGTRTRRRQASANDRNNPNNKVRDGLDRRWSVGCYDAWR